MLIDEVTSNGEHNIDENRIFCAGHSHGGMTALFTGTREPRVKAVISLDPWFFPFKE